MAVGDCSFRRKLPSPQTHVSQGALAWARAGCSPRKTKAHSGKLQTALRWKTHGMGLSQFPNGCQLPLTTADTLKWHCNLPPSWTTRLLLLEPCWVLGQHQGQEQPHSWSTAALAGKRKGEEVFLFAAISTQRAGILCANRLLDAALWSSRSEEQTALDTANESLWAL